LKIEKDYRYLQPGIAIVCGDLVSKYCCMETVGVAGMDQRVWLSFSLFIVQNARMEITASSPEKTIAFSKFPSNTALYMASETVSVLPLILPPSMSVMPTSPKERPTESVRPARTERLTFGRITLRNVVVSLFPRTNDASFRE